MEWEDPRVKTPWGDEQREDLPLVWERPDPGSPQAYREDEIVSLWSSIFSLMSRLNYREPEDFIYPPKETGRHSFDKYDLLVDKGMSREAVSLAERLPFSRDVPNSDLILHKNSVPVSFFHHWHPKYCREITLPSEGRSMDKTLGKLLPQDFVFVFGLDPYSFDWILDLEYNVFRFIRSSSECPARDGHELPEDYPVELPDHPGHYRNWPRYHAPTVLRRWIQDVLDLKLVPGIHNYWWNDPSEADFHIIAKALRQYGWPENFRDEDWARDKEQIHKNVEALGSVYGSIFRNPAQPGQTLIEWWEEDPGRIPHASTFRPAINVAAELDLAGK